MSIMHRSETWDYVSINFELISSTIQAMNILLDDLRGIRKVY